MSVKHETCQQYVARRLSEGWGIAGSWKHLVFLSPPEGNFIRVVDLRNDVETLRPNALGDEELIAFASPAADHYLNVDEESPDENTTYLYTLSTTYTRDLYNLPASSGSGTINSVKIYIRIAIGDAGGTAYAKPSLKSNTTVTDGTEVSKTGATTYETFSQTWNTNPADAGAWEWAEIDALQIGLQLKTSYRAYDARCTQVYVEVDYVGITAPTVTTQAVTSIGTTTATGNGNITDTGGENCSKRGVCWNTTGNPTVADDKSEETDSFGTGAFTRAMTGLASPMKFYVKAYAYNSGGYGYGAQVTFTTKAASSVIVGAVASAARTFGRIRAATVIIGIIASALPAIKGRVRVASVLIGNLVSATRGLGTFTRASSVIAGIVASAVRNITTTKPTSAVIVGVKATATRGIATFTRTGLKTIGVVVSAIEPGRALTRASSVIVGALITASAVVGVQRAIVYIGVKVTAARNITKILPSAATIIGVVVTVAHSRGYIRAALTLIGEAITAIHPPWGRSRASSVIVGAKVTATRLIMAARSSSVLLGIITAATRNITITRQAVVSIGALVSALIRTIGRVLTIKAITTQYRGINLITTMYRKIKSFTGG